MEIEDLIGHIQRYKEKLMKKEAELTEKENAKQGLADEVTQLKEAKEEQEKLEK